MVGSDPWLPGSWGILLNDAEPSRTCPHCPGMHRVQGRFTPKVSSPSLFNSHINAHQVIKTKFIQPHEIQFTKFTAIDMSIKILCFF